MFERFSGLGFITEQDWNDLFMLTVLCTSVLINTLLIFVLARQKKKRLNTSPVMLAGFLFLLRRIS